MTQNHPAVLVARIYLVILLVINLSLTIWANCVSFRIQQNILELPSQQNTTQESTIPNSSIDVFTGIVEDAKESLKPIIQAGEVAKTATPIFIVGIFASLITNTLMIYPKYCMDSITKHIPLFDMDFESIDKFWRIVVICNIALFVFDLLGTIGYWDFASALIG